MSAPDNPQALPVSTIDGYTVHGMTLRDYFAGQALAGLCANPVVISELPEPKKAAQSYAAMAIAIADAAIKARSIITKALTEGDKS
jgi:hypothetical protein